MCVSISNRMVHLKEMSNWIFTSTRLHWFLHELVERVVQILSIIILNDHVMHDHTFVHNVRWNLLMPKHSQPYHNRKFGLQNPKITLSIFPSSRLIMVEIYVFFNYE